jgi:DNA segregation ATPase FtsK/SpoIIIE, S-DNA-T family
MLDHRNVRRDLAALGLGALVVFLAAALVSYDPADPLPRPLAPLSFVYQPDPLVHPPHAAATNWCGTWGALAADGLFTLLGLGAYYFVFSLAVLDWQLLRRNEIDMPAMRALGWIASLIGATTIAAIALPNFSPGPVIGSGGYLGALGRGVAQMHFAAAGSLIIASSVTLGGLLLATDYALIRGAIFVVQLKSAARRRSWKRRSPISASK